MRLLDLTTLYLDGGEGGVNTYLREKARHIATRRVDVEHTIITCGRTTRSERVERSDLHFVRSPRLPGNPTHRVIVDFRRVRELLVAIAPDVVEVDCSYFLPRVARQALGAGVPIVGTIHAHLPRLYTRAVRNPLRRWFTRRTEFLSWRYSEFCARACDRVVATSLDVIESCDGRRFPPLEHVPLGVNLDLFRPRPRHEAQELPGVDPTRPTVVYVGRLSPEKDLELLWRAHRELHARTGSQLVVAGEGPLARTVERFAARDGATTYLGPVPYGPRLAELYAAADVLAVPSPNEAFGLVVLEALACGLPVVAVASGGPAETLRDGHGFLARPGDAADFADCLERALGDVGETAVRCRRAYVEGRYSWDATFEALFSLYESFSRPRVAARTT